MKNQKRFPLFSNGTEFMLWTLRNCDRCIKAVFYNEKKNTCPKYKCRIQEHIEIACIGDGMGNERDYKATHSYICPHIKTERKKPRKKTNENELTLF